MEGWELLLAPSTPKIYIGADTRIPITSQIHLNGTEITREANSLAQNRAVPVISGARDSVDDSRVGIGSSP